MNPYRTNFSCCARTIQEDLKSYRLKKLVAIKTGHYSKPTLDNGILNEAGALLRQRSVKVVTAERIKVEENNRAVPNR